MAVDLFTGQPFEIKPLATGEDGRGEFMALRGGKDKDDVRRRLLQGFQEGVKGFRRQHMRFINNVYLVVPFHRGKLHPFPKDADLVDSPVGSPVNLQNIHGNPVVNPAATRAIIAGVGAIPPGPAVYRFGENLRTRSLPWSPPTAEKIGMGDLAKGQSISQSTNHMFLAGKSLAEALGAPLPVQTKILQ